MLRFHPVAQQHHTPFIKCTILIPMAPTTRHLLQDRARNLMLHNNQVLPQQSDALKLAIEELRQVGDP